MTETAPPSWPQPTFQIVLVDPIARHSPIRAAQIQRVGSIANDEPTDILDAVAKALKVGQAMVNRNARKELTYGDFAVQIATVERVKELPLGAPGREENHLWKLAKGAIRLLQGLMEAIEAEKTAFHDVHFGCISQQSQESVSKDKVDAHIDAMTACQAELRGHLVRLDKTVDLGDVWFTED